MCVHLNNGEISKSRACLWSTNSTFIRENSVADGTYDYREFDLTQGDVWEDRPQDIDSDKDDSHKDDDKDKDDEDGDSGLK